MKISGVFVRFLFIYLALIAVMDQVIKYFSLPSSNSFSILILIVATVFSCVSFAKKNGRYFSRKERFKVIIGFIITDFFIQVLFGFLSFTGTIDLIKVGALLLALTLITILHSIIIYMFFNMPKKSLIRKGIIKSRSQNTSTSSNVAS